MKTISIVIPCFNEEDILKDTIYKLSSLLENLCNKGLISEKSLIEFVDDGSTDSTWELIKSFKCNYNIHALRLSHNKGHQIALLAGLLEAKDNCDITITLDADLQDDIYVIEEMLTKYLNGAEIVYGIRNDRSTDRLFKRYSAKAFYKLMEVMGTELIPEHADFRLLDQTAVEYLSEYDEKNLFLRGIIPQLGLESDTVYYKRHKREKGKSKYSLSKMISLAWEGITSMSEKPLQLSIVGSILCFINGTRLHFCGFGDNKEINAVRFEMWMLMSLQMLLMSIYGEYAAKTYTEVKGRPRYKIKERI